MTLADARATVRQWWIPANEARIERVSYVALADVIDILFAESEELYLLGGYDTVYYVDRLRALTPGPIIAIEVSQRGIDLLGHEHAGNQQHFGNAEQPNQCMPVPYAKRYTYYALWDARRGFYLGHGFGGLPEALWQRAAEVPPRLVHVTATPRPTASPATPSVPPTPTTTVRFSNALRQDLGDGEVPAAVLAVAEVLPWVRGARWTYRETDVRNGVQWSTSALTETVVASSRLASDVMEVRVRCESSPERSYPACPWGAGLGWHSVEPAAEYLVPDGVFTAHFSQAWPQALDTFRQEAARLLHQGSRWDMGDPVALVQLPLRVDEQYNYWWHAERQETVNVPAGTFEGCYALVEIVNAGNSWAHWLCPGVGFVRHELPGCSTQYGGYSVLELVDYHIPRVVAVP